MKTYEVSWRSLYFGFCFILVLNDCKLVNKIDPKVRNSTFYLSFRNTLIKFIRSSQNIILNIHDQVGISLLTELRLGFGHLLEKKKKNIYHFKNTLIQLYPWVSIVKQQCIFIFCVTIPTMWFWQNLWVTY